MSLFEREAGISPSFLYIIFIAAYGFGTLGYLVCGSMMERLGRRPTAITFDVVSPGELVLSLQGDFAVKVSLL